MRLAATRQRRQVGSVSVEMVSFQSVNSVAERNYFDGCLSAIAIRSLSRGSILV